MNLDDVLRAKVLREYKSKKSDMMLTTMKKREEDWDADALVNEVSESDEAKLTFVKKNLSLPEERKKGDEMLVMSKASCPIDHDDLLMNIVVSESQGIRDDLRRLVRSYLDDELSLLKMNYQSNTWYVSVSFHEINQSILPSHEWVFLRLCKIFWMINESTLL